MKEANSILVRAIAFMLESSFGSEVATDDDKWLKMKLKMMKLTGLVPSNTATSKIDVLSSKLSRRQPRQGHETSCSQFVSWCVV